MIFVVQENAQKSRKLFIKFEVVGEAQRIFQVLKYDGFVNERFAAAEEGCCSVNIVIVNQKIQSGKISNTANIQNKEKHYDWKPTNECFLTHQATRKPY